MQVKDQVIVIFIKIFTHLPVIANRGSFSKGDQGVNVGMVLQQGHKRIQGQEGDMPVGKCPANRFQR